ncbi:MAG: toll/interleukin-1 receptor domain-containing protein, partial [Thermomicrobiales bacterium]
MAAQPSQIFISYQRTDDAFARQVRDRLVQAGVRVWMDQFDIPVGAYWPDEIDKGLT